MTMTWADVVQQLWPPDSRHHLRLPKGTVPHPLTVKGMRPSAGLPEGQLRDFRVRLGTTTAGLHVKEFQHHYEAHLDAHDPSVQPVEHFVVDAPGAFIGGTAALGAIIGAAAGRSGGAAAGGAILGALLAALIASESR